MHIPFDPFLYLISMGWYIVFGILHECNEYDISTWEKPVLEEKVRSGNNDGNYVGRQKHDNNLLEQQEGSIMHDKDNEE